MLQEIITYLIVAAAVGFSAYKVFKRFYKKKAPKVNFKTEKFTMEHNCSDCSAECVLRDLPKAVIKTKSEECDTNYHSK